MEDWWRLKYMRKIRSGWKRRPGNRKRSAEGEGEGLRTLIRGEVGGEGRDEDSSLPPSLPAPLIYSWMHSVRRHRERGSSSSSALRPATGSPLRTDAAVHGPWTGTWRRTGGQSMELVSYTLNISIRWVHVVCNVGFVIFTMKMLLLLRYHVNLEIYVVLICISSLMKSAHG